MQSCSTLHIGINQFQYRRMGDFQEEEIVCRYYDWKNWNRFQESSGEDRFAVSGSEFMLWIK